MINKVILLGNVGKDPEIRTVGDTKVANFSLATTDRAYKTKNGIEVPEKTEWHNIVVWRGLATVVENYVKKGSQLYIEGKIRTRNYEAQDGSKRYVTEILADNLQMLSKASGNTQSVQPPLQENIPAGEPSDDLPF